MWLPTDGRHNRPMSSFRAFLAVLGLSCLVAACTPTGQQATPETVGDGTCALAATRNHPVGDVVHPDLSGSLSAQAPLGTTLTLTSLDGAIPGEVSDDADESGWISLAVPAGRWRAVLARGSETLDESTLTVEGGETIHLDLRTP